MENKYEVTNAETMNENTILYTINDIETSEEHSCLLIIKPNHKAKVLTDDMANKFDIGEALFQYDLDILPYLPLYMVSYDMYREYQDYHPGKGNCLFDLPDEYEKAYLEEEKRVSNMRSMIKQLIK